MIVLFHTFCVVTRYIMRVISKSFSNKAEEVNSEENTNSDFVLSDYHIISSEAEFESGIGMRFFPPVYTQRYSTVKNILQDERWSGKIRKVVDFGCAEFRIFPYVKHIPGLQEVVSVDIDREMLDHYCCRAAPLNADYLDIRQEPLTVRVLAGSIADRDARLLGTDAVICIELIEHLYPDTLEAVPYTVFGFIQPLIAIFTTPNSDFNVLFPDFTGFRHSDHKFEWSRDQFEDWATNITRRYPAYIVKFRGIGQGPKGTEVHGCCSQMAVFVKLRHHAPAPGAQLTSQREDLEEEECEEKYVTVREYNYPFYVDDRTDEEKTLQNAEYYISLLTREEEFWSDVNIQIPLQRLLPHVEMWCNSTLVLRNILEEAGWKVVGETQGDEAVLYPNYEECESSVHESEDSYCKEEEDQAASLQVPSHGEENWDVPQILCGYDCGNCVSSRFVEDMSSVQPEDWSYGVIKPQCGVHLQRDGDLESQDFIESSNDSCKNREDSTHVSSDVIECVDCVPLRHHLSIKNAEKIIKSTSQHSNSFSTDLNSKDDNVQSLVDSESGLSVEQTSIPSIGHCGNKEDFEFSKVVQNCTPVSAANVELSQKLVLKACSNNEALTDQTSETHKKVGQILTLCSYSEDSKVIGKHQNSQCLERQLSAGQLKGLNANLSSECMVLNSSSTRNTEQFINVCQNSHTEESLSAGFLYHNFKREVADCSTSQVVMSQALNLGSGSSSIQESSQDRSLVESCSLDEQNDRAVDSGYPNSFSVQDMDMDLTPEQVDELSTESDDIITENIDNSEYYDSESSEKSDHIENNDRLLFHFPHEALYDPMGLVVENGDVANNNRDGEGNNAVAVPVIHPPPEPEVDPADDVFIPLLAAAEDFDNDNDLILPDDEPFPQWLLHLLDVANHGGGDAQNYVVPPVDDFVLPDEGVGDIDDDDDSGEPSSCDRGSILDDFSNDEVVLDDSGGGKVDGDPFQNGF